MSWVDYGVLALVAGYIVYLVLFRKKKHCCGCCETCCSDCKERQ